MEFRFYRELKHNYFVIDADEEDLSDYQYKMLENNKVNGIIPLDLRRMDNRCAFYYEIDSKQSMSVRYQTEKMGYDKVMVFLQDYIETCKNLEEYLLDDKCLIVNEDFIFEDLPTGKFFFIYKLGGDECSKDLGSLLIDLTDLSDEKASDLVYDICDITKEVFSYHSLEQIINKQKGYISDDIFEEDEEHNVKVMPREGDSTQNYAFDGYLDENDNDDYEKSFEAYPDTSKKSRKFQLSGRLSFLLGGLFLIVAGALIYLRIFFYLTYEEGLIDLGTFMVSIMMSLICFIQGFRKKPRKDVLEDKYEDDEDITDSDQDLYSDNEYDDEETVLLGFDLSEPQRTLRGIDEMEGTVFHLNDNEMTIGKNPAGNDFSIKEPTVSRMHARLFWEDNDNEYSICDAGSKNGTFVNGRKLQKNKKRLLKKGDKVSFGKCSFAYI
ncbi:DUF6382 domain-containing protein [Butyrivibrio sp. NC2002]|uniref:DUF6382 domain-containing protein n=1 Tax=Butyrivibrio sp. NC2002 TaxID=1410610 RepID=UPI000560C8E3|nr:DUF6382 domain-containing protein [Butyrivibrio sp. NC2002]